MIYLYTDGSCKGNPGPGGWGCYIKSEEESYSKGISGGEPSTTNNRMELMAVIQGLMALDPVRPVHIITDSKYVMNGVQNWMTNWRKNGWVTADRKPVKNKDLWLQLDKLLPSFQLIWQWVKGHTGVEGNEVADMLATDAAELQSLLLNSVPVDQDKQLVPAYKPGTTLFAIIVDGWSRDFELTQIADEAKGMGYVIDDQSIKDFVTMLDNVMELSHVATRILEPKR